MFFSLAAVTLIAAPLPRSGGSAVCLLMDDRPSADPLKANSPADIDIARACYITLFQLGGDGMPQPYLCEDFELNWFDGDLRIVIRDASFSNGSAISAEDCKFTIVRAIGGRADLRDGFSVIEGIDEYIDGSTDAISGIRAESSDTLVFHLISPEGTLNLLEALSNPATGIISKARYESMGGNYFNAPVTSGPFAFAASTGKITLTPQPGFPFGKPWLDSIVLKTGGNEQAHLDFSVGAVDLLEVPPAYYLQYQNDITLYERSAEAGAMLEYILLLDPAVPPLNEPAVRKAIRMAIDHRGLADVTLGGAALSTYTLPADVARTDYRTRVEMAKTALVDYGDLVLTPLKIAYPQGDGRAGLMAEKIANNLKPLGFTVSTLTVPNFGTSGSRINAGILLMPFPVSTVSEPAPSKVVKLAREWGFGSDALGNIANAGDTSKNFYLPILRPQRLVVTGEGFLAPSLGMWGEIDFYRLSLG